MNSKRIEIFALIWSVFLLTAPALVYAIAGNNVVRHGDVDTLARIARYPLSIGIILFVLAVAGSRIFMWASLPLSVLALLETFNVLVMKKPSSIGTIGSMLDTNSREANEIVGAYMPFVMLGVILLAIHLVIFLKTRKQLQKTTPLRFRAWMFVIGLCLLTPELVIIGTLPWPRECKMAIYKMDVKDTFPFGTMLKTGLAFQSKWNLAYRTIARHSFDWKPNRKLGTGVRETYILIIGESSRPGNWSLYGYNKPTNPRLQEHSDLLIFKDMTSGAAETTESVPMYLSLATPDGIHRFDSTLSILSCFRQAGFKTWWISTQGRFGAWDVKPSMIGKEADEWKFLNIDPQDETLHDGALLPFFDKALSDTASRKLIVLHTSGSHFQYSARYPKGFAKFTVVNEEEYEVGSYDNSIYYTDWFLDQMLSRVKKASGIRSMIYISDHGEALGELDCYNHSNDEPPRSEFEVPFIVWMSDELKRTRPEVVSQLQSHLEAKASAPDFLPTFLDIADVHSHWIDTTRSLGRAIYRPRVRHARLPDGNLADVDKLTGSSFYDSRLVSSK